MAKGDPFNLTDRDEEFQFSVESVLSAEREVPLVGLRWRDDDQVVVDIETATKIGHDILDVCHASVGDAFIFRFLIDKLEVPKEAAAQTVLAMRGYRAVLREQEGG